VFRRDVDAAAVGWAFVSAAWFLPRALVDDPPPVNPSKPMSTRRAMILHRLDQHVDPQERPRWPSLRPACTTRSSPDGETSATRTRQHSTNHEPMDSPP
jgi:hypothetical protein